MIDALVSGKLYDTPQQRANASGKTFTVGKVRVPPARAGDESTFVSFACFRADLQDALLALNSGDSVALAGDLRLRTWTGRDGTKNTGLDLLVSGMLSTFDVERKRAAAQGHPEAARPEVRGKAGRPLDESWRAGAPADEVAF